MSESSKKRYRKLKRDVIDHYGGSCSCCGLTDIRFLAIDHIKGGGTQDRIKRTGGRGGMPFYSYLRSRGFPTGLFQVLCHNCNQGKTSTGYCPHEESEAVFNAFYRTYTRRFDALH